MCLKENFGLISAVPNFNKDDDGKGGEVGSEFGVVNEIGIVNDLSNERAYHSEGTWHIGTWIGGYLVQDW